MGRAGRSGGSSGRSSGGRSSGSSSRSSGGRSSFGSSGRSGGSSFGSSSRSSSGGSIFGGISKRPSSISSPSWTNTSYRKSGGVTYGSSPFRSRNTMGSSGCGCSTLMIVGIIIVIIVIMLGASGFSTGITYSTIEREALPKGSVIETEYFTDELNWIKNETELERGLKHFYNKTGVQPYVYITDNVDGGRIYSDEELEDFTRRLYEELFKDEAHILLTFYEYDGDYAYHYVAGAQAKTVIDREAADILMDYIDRYYCSDKSEEDMFSTAFANTADDMMEVYESPWVKVFLVIGAGVVILIIFTFWKSAKKQKNIEAEQTEKILNTKLEEFGDSEAEELSKKYEDNEGV